MNGRTDGRAVMTKLIVAFRNFAETPKNGNNRCVIRKYDLLVQNLVVRMITIGRQNASDRLLGYYTVQCNVFVPTFRGSPCVHLVSFQANASKERHPHEPKTDDCARKSVRNIAKTRHQWHIYRFWRPEE
jgi:hypothetical protein